MKKLLIILISLSLTGCWKMREGEKVGQILDVYKSGFLISTWECSLTRGGLEDGSGVLGGTRNLTIVDKHVLNKAKEYMIKKKNVKVMYHRELICPFSSDSECYFIDDIEEIS